MIARLLVDRIPPGGTYINGRHFMCLQPGTGATSGIQTADKKRAPSVSGGGDIPLVNGGGIWAGQTFRWRESIRIKRLQVK